MSDTPVNRKLITPLKVVAACVSYKEMETNLAVPLQPRVCHFAATRRQCQVAGFHSDSGWFARSLLQHLGSIKASRIRVDVEHSMKTRTLPVESVVLNLRNLRSESQILQSVTDHFAGLRSSRERRMTKGETDGPFWYTHFPHAAVPPTPASGIFVRFLLTTSVSDHIVRHPTSKPRSLTPAAPAHCDFVQGCPRAGLRGRGERPCSIRGH